MPAYRSDASRTASEFALQKHVGDLLVRATLKQAGHGRPVAAFACSKRFEDQPVKLVAALEGFKDFRVGLAFRPSDSVKLEANFNVKLC